LFFSFINTRKKKKVIEDENEDYKVECGKTNIAEEEEGETHFVW